MRTRTTGRGALEQRAEQGLREGEARLRQIAENIREAFWIHDCAKLSQVYVSPAFAAIWGRSSESLGDDPAVLLDWVHPEDRARVASSVEDYSAARDSVEDFRIVRPDGQVRSIRVQAFPVRDLTGALARIVGTADDITERRELEERLRQSRKLEAIGTLAGGIAHDFNNVLTGILGFTSLARDAAGDEVETRERIEEISRAATRAVDLVRQILAFSRVDGPALAPLHLGEVVSEAARLLRAAIPRTIALEIDLAPTLPQVLGNATQLHQVLMNLGTNAWHAMRDQAGRLSIRLDACTVDEAQAQALSNIRPGLHVRLTVGDPGCGMDEATMARIFEPFFTTKAPGDGTGLGLSVVHGIVRGHRGAIRLVSEVGSGTRFEIYLPAIASRPSSSERDAGARRGGRGAPILFVDDEPQLGRLGQRLLRQLGYEPVYVSGGPEALARLESEPPTLSLIITDLTMPGLTGLELAARVQTSWPHTPWCS